MRSGRLTPLGLSSRHDAIVPLVLTDAAAALLRGRPCL